MDSNPCCCHIVGLQICISLRHSTALLHTRTYSILNYVTYMCTHVYALIVYEMLFYNMIYTHHSRININDLLNKFPIICNIQKCVEREREWECVRERKTALHFHSFVDLFHLVIWLLFFSHIHCVCVYLFWITQIYWDNVVVGNDYDDEEAEEQRRTLTRTHTHIYNTQWKLKTEFFKMHFYTSEKCINTIIYC